jgi:hypothetical protein
LVATVAESLHHAHKQGLVLCHSLIVG